MYTREYLIALFFPAQHPYWFVSVLPHNPILFTYPYFPNTILFPPKKYRNGSRNEIFFVCFRPFSSLPRGGKTLKCRDWHANRPSSPEKGGNKHARAMLSLWVGWCPCIVMFSENIHESPGLPRSRIPYPWAGSRESNNGFHVILCSVHYWQCDDFPNSQSQTLFSS